MKLSMLVSVLCLAFLAACGGSVSIDKDWDSLQPSGLPALLGFGDCDPQPAVSICDWALAADEIVWGTLQEVRFVDHPALVMSGPRGDTLTDSCTGSIESAFELDIAIDHSIRGALTGTVTIRGGVMHRYKFDPHPNLGPAGTIEWASWSGAPLGQPLIIGRKLGAAFYRLPTGEFSFMGQPLFGVGTDTSGRNVIRFQQMEDDCQPPVPTDFATMSIGGMKSFVDACSPQSANAEKLRRVRLVALEFPHWTDPSEYRAARCFP